ncbi:MAG TPA: hypothetical protein V6D22_11965 [Candidatus Obscuribacterales bacterium]
MCELEERYKQQHPGVVTESESGLYNSIMPAPPNSEAANLANTAARWAGQNGAQLLGGEQFNSTTPHWFNLRAEQAIMAQAGWQFGSGFRTGGPVSIDDIRNVMVTGSKGQSRFQEVQGPARVGDVVGSAVRRNEIDMQHTCGLKAALGIVEPGGFIKLQAGTVVRTPSFPNYGEVKIFRPVP